MKILNKKSIKNIPFFFLGLRELVGLLSFSSPTPPPLFFLLLILFVGDKVLLSHAPTPNLASPYIALSFDDIKPPLPPLLKFIGRQ